MVSETVWRRILPVGAALVFGVAAIVIVGVIPPVSTDPLTMVDTAIPSFWDNVVANVLVGIALLGTIFITRRDALVGKVLVWIAGFVGLLSALFLLDAARAFAQHGPSMRRVTVALFVCVGGDLVAGALALVATVLRLRK